MASNNCTYVYNGINYTEEEIKKVLIEKSKSIYFTIDDMVKLHTLYDPAFTLMSKDEKSYLNTQFYKNFPEFPKTRVKFLYAVANSGFWGLHTKAGITLYEASVSGTAYREAWREFSRFFLTKEEQKSLYEELIKTNPNFKGYSINNRQQVIELEGHLADDFKPYMFSKDINKSAPKRNIIFRQIWKYLKGLLGNNKEKFQDRLNEIYKELREEGVPDRYNFNLENDYFNSEDNFFSTIPGFNNLKLTEINPSEATVKTLDFFDDTIAQVLLDNKYSVEDIFAQKNLKYEAYTSVKNTLVNHALKVKNNKKLDAKTKADLLEFYDYILNNFDDFVNLHKQKGKLNLSNYDKTTFEDFSELERQNTPEEGKEEEDEKDPEVNEGRNLAGIEKSHDSKAIAAAQVRFLIASLRKVDKKNKNKINKYGFVDLVDFEKTWNLLSNELSGITSYRGMYKKIEILKEDYPEFNQLLKSLPDPDKKDFSTSEDFLANRFRTDLMRFKRIIWINSLEIARNKEGNITDLQYKYLQASNIALKALKESIKMDWLQDKENPYTKYIDTEKVVDTEKIYNTFANKQYDGYKNIYHNNTFTPEQFEQVYQNRLEFLKSVGIYFSDKVTASDKFKDYILFNDQAIGYLMSAIKDIVVFNEEEKALTETEKKVKLEEKDKHYVIIREPISFFSNKVILQHTGAKSKKNDIPSNLARINELLSWEVKLSGNYHNNSSYNATLNIQNENVLYSTLSLMVTALNDFELYPTYQDFIAVQEHQMFDVNKNPNIRDSIYLNNLFDLETGRRKKVLVNDTGRNQEDLPYVQLTLDDFNGLNIKDNEGEDRQFFGKNTVDLDPLERSVLNVISMLKNGTSEMMRIADKSQAIALKINNLHINGKRKKSKLFFNYFGEDSIADIDLSTLHSNNDIKVNQDYKDLNFIFRGYLKNELEKIYKTMRVLKEGTDIVDLEKKMLKFSLFNKLLDDNTKTDLMNKLKELSDLDPNLDYKTSLEPVFDKWIMDEEYPKELKKEILESIGTYLENKTNLYESLLYKKGYIAGTLQTILDPGNKGNEKQLIRAFILNRFVLNIEESKLLYGDIGLFKDFFKRLPMYAATGSTSESDPNYFIKLSQEINYRAHAKALNKKVDAFDGTVNVSVIKDVSNSSDLGEDYYDTLLKSTKGNVEMQNQIKSMKETYEKGEKEADGQGIISLDFYRLFKKSIGFWYPEHEKAYEAMVNLIAEQNKAKPNKALLNKLKAEASEKAYLFPPIKLSHGGPIVDKDFYLPNYLKFSVYPALPNLHSVKSNMDNLIEKMYESKTDILVFESGSKVINKGKDGKLQNIYSDLTTRELTKDKLYNFKTYLKYYKEQLQIEPKKETEAIFGTQFRKLLFSNKFVNGVPIDVYMPAEDWFKLSKDERKAISPLYSLYKEYNDTIFNIVKIEMENLTEELGINLEYKEDGTIDFKKLEIENFDKLVTILLAEADKKQAPDSLADFLIVENNKLKYPIEASKDKKLIQDILLSIVNNRLVKQKVNGQALVQAAQTFNEHFNGKDYSDTLKYYKTVKIKKGGKEYTKVESMEVMVSFNSNYQSLLFLESPVDGQVIGTVDRLNEAMRDKDWYKANNKFFTMIGYRIPTQASNSFANMKIKQFLNPSSMNLIVLPKQITIQAGSDFDIDKMTIIRPYIKDGQVIQPVKDRIKRSELNKEITRVNEEIKRIKANQKIIKGDLQEVLDALTLKLDDSFNNLLIYRYNYYKALNTYEYNLQQLEQYEEKLEEHPSMKVLLQDEIEKIKYQRDVSYHLFNNLSMLDDWWNNEVEEGTKNKVEANLDLHKKEFKSLNKLYKEKEKLQEHANYQKKANTNKIIEIGKKIMEREDSLFHMTFPNSTYVLKDQIADNIKKELQANGKEDFISFTNDTDSFDPSVVDEVYSSFVGGKKTLGIAALQAPFTQLLQKIGALANPQFKFGKNIFKTLVYLQTQKRTVTKNNKTEEVIDFSGSHDINKEYLKSEIFSQFINAYVDIAKEPFIFYMNAGIKVAPVLMYLTHAGTPIKQASYFINQDSIRAYVKRLTQTDSMVNKIINEKNERGEYDKLDAMMSTWNEFAPENYQLNRLDFITDSGYSNTSKFYKMAQDVLLQIEASVGLENLEKSFSFEVLENELKNVNNNKNLQMIYLAQYIMLELQSASLREVSDSLKPDTQLDKTVMGAYSKYVNLKKLTDPTNDSKILQNLSIKRLTTETEISPFVNVSPFIYQLWKGVEVLQTNPVVQSKLYALLESPGTKKGKLNQERLIREFLNDLTLFIVQNKGKFFMDNQARLGYSRDFDYIYRHILDKEDVIKDNINTMYMNLRGKYDGKNGNPSLEEISTIFNYIKPNRSYFTDLFTMKWTGPTINTDLINNLTNEWRRFLLLKDPKYKDITDFFKLLSQVVFISYGEGRSKDSFFNLVPSEVHAEFILPYLQDFLSKINDENSETAKMFDYFDILFKKNNPIFFNKRSGKPYNDRKFKQYRLELSDDPNLKGAVGNSILDPILTDKLKRKPIVLSENLNDEKPEEDTEVTKTSSYTDYEETPYEESLEPSREVLASAFAFEDDEEEKPKVKQLDLFSETDMGNFKNDLKKSFKNGLYLDKFKDRGINNESDLDSLNSEEIKDLYVKICKN